MNASTYDPILRHLNNTHPCETRLSTLAFMMTVSDDVVLQRLTSNYLAIADAGGGESLQHVVERRGPYTESNRKNQARQHQLFVDALCKP